MPERLRNAFASGWLSYNVRLANHLRNEAENRINENPASLIAALRSNSQRHGVEANLWHIIQEQTISMIYGSNLIESAGTSMTETARLCQVVFRGEEITLPDGTTEQNKSREVINHARALHFMISQVAFQNSNITEDMILNLHAMLFDDMEIKEGLIPGQYRVDEVAVRYGENKKVTCIRASAVPGHMAALISHLQADMSKATNEGVVDPYTLAARYHHQFVMIHPFLDGNGRISRIILNTLLLKYAGHLTAFGLDENEKVEYLTQVRQDAKVFHQEDLVVEFSEQRFHLKFAGLVLRKSVTSLKALQQCIKE